MSWADKWSGRFTFYEDLLSKGRVREEDIEPDLGPFSFYLDAFGVLGTCRQIGMGAGPIPFTAILEYSNLYDVGDFESFFTVIKMMDEKFLQIQAEKLDKKKSKDGNNGNANKTNQGRR